MVVERYVFIGRTIGVNCDQMIECASKIKKANPRKRFALLKNDITGSEPAFGIANILQNTQVSN